MPVAPGSGAVAAGEPAVLVAGDQRDPHGCGQYPCGRADVEDRGAAVGEDAVHGAVTQDPLEGFLVPERAVDAAAFPAVDIQQHVDVRTMPSAGLRGLVVQEEL